MAATRFTLPVYGCYRYQWCTTITGAVDPDGIRDGTFCNGYPMMVGTVVAAYVADEPTLARKRDQSMTFLWRNHQASFK
jgi:hypothetical protein